MRMNDIRLTKKILNIVRSLKTKATWNDRDMHDIRITEEIIQYRSWYIKMIDSYQFLRQPQVQRANSKRTEQRKWIHRERMKKFIKIINLKRQNEKRKKNCYYNKPTEINLIKLVFYFWFLAHSIKDYLRRTQPN